jgi:hypothetical protein
MSPKEIRNLSASVLARLLTRARQTGDDYQNLITAFLSERFLYRLGASKVHDRFVLKGAMLLRLWADQPYRATRDLDFLRLGGGTAEAIRTDVEEICTTKVAPDGVAFEPQAIGGRARTVDGFLTCGADLGGRCSARTLSPEANDYH